MSTAKDEAEIGRTKSQRDEENGIERPEEEEEEEEDEDESPRNFTGPASLEFEDTQGGKNNPRAQSVRSRIRNGHDLTLLKNSNLESSLNLERPSSAGGSFSIPDDTPSIQVKKSLKSAYSY